MPDKKMTMRRDIDRRNKQITEAKQVIDNLASVARRHGASAAEIREAGNVDGNWSKLKAVCIALIVLAILCYGSGIIMLALAK